MQIKSFETNNNTYYLGYGKIAKTSYEFQEETKQERKYMLLQKLIALCLIIVGLIGSFVIKDAGFTVVCSLIGLPVLITKEHVVCL